MTPSDQTPLRADARNHTTSPAAASSSGATGEVAILGWSVAAIESMYRSTRAWLVVGPPDTEAYARANQVPFLPWDLETFDLAEAHRLATVLEARGVRYTVPLFEPLVEWHGVIDGYLRDDPTLLDWAMLFRDKARMKRRAQLGDIPVGVFTVAKERGEVTRFLDEVNLALLAHDPVKAVHVKAFDQAGCKGHYRITSHDDAERVPDDAFPCLVESELQGQEIACEVWVHDREIVFMNISEYVHLGHSVFVPPSPALEARREELREMNQRLVDAFEIERGFIHPEWFLADDGSIHFGEVAYRVPGANAFELIERAYRFDPYEGIVRVMDPDLGHDEVRAFFPREDAARGHAGVLLAYPDPSLDLVQAVQLPPALIEDPAFDGHDLMLPATPEVERPERFVNGTHWGHVYLFSDDAARIRRLCLKFENHRFYR